MQALRQAGVQLIVAPYEADAQLAFLSRTGAVDVVITEDSDCLPYGCKKVILYQFETLRPSRGPSCDRIKTSLADVRSML